MEATYTSTEQRAHLPVGTLGRSAAIAMAVLSALLFYLQLVVVGSIIPPVMLLSVLGLIFAGLIVMGYRWSPFPVAGVALMVIAGNAPFIAYDLTHPGDSSFMLSLIVTTTAVITIISGLAAGTQSYRGEDRATPSWFPYVMTALVAVAAGALLIGMLPRPGAAAGVSPELLASLDPITTEQFQFGQQEIRVGSADSVAFRLENLDSANHSFDIDALGVHAPMPAGAESLVIFDALQPGEYTFYCGVPGHADLSTGEGMIGTLIIE